jgi:hypothetical protein
MDGVLVATFFALHELIVADGRRYFCDGKNHSTAWLVRYLYHHNIFSPFFPILSLLSSLPRLLTPSLVADLDLREKIRQAHRELLLVAIPTRRRALSSFRRALLRSDHLD